MEFQVTATGTVKHEDKLHERATATYSMTLMCERELD